MLERSEVNLGADLAKYNKAAAQVWETENSLLAQQEVFDALTRLRSFHLSDDLDMPESTTKSAQQLSSVNSSDNNNVCVQLITVSL